MLGQVVGWLFETNVPNELKERKEHILRNGISNEEGKMVFNSLFSLPYPQILVSTRDIKYVIHENKSFYSNDIFLTKSGKNTVKNHKRPRLYNEYAAPTSNIEIRISKLWSDAFNIERIGVHDNFFDLGGHSLMAVQLVAKLRQIFSNEIPQHIILKTPTIRKLAEFIENWLSKNDTSDEDQASALELIVQLKKGKAHKTPLFLIHPIGGQVYFYRELVDALESDHPNLWNCSS